MGLALRITNEQAANVLRKRLEGEGFRFVHSLPEASGPGDDPVLVWGAEAGPLPKLTEVLNRPSAARRCETAGKLAALLPMHGIAVAHTRSSNNPDGAFPFHYRVPVFNLEALTLYCAESNAAVRLRMDSSTRKLGRILPVFAETGLERADKRGTAAIRLAVRALYALGLDYGVVEVVIPAAGSAEVLKVEPYPELDDRLADLFAGAIRRYAREHEADRRKHRPPVLGADPEFLLADRAGRIVHASRYLPKQGEAGCDVLTIRGIKRFPLGELRPEPASDPRRLIRHLRRAMLQAESLIDDEELRWVAGGMPALGFALGGHLHVSQIWLHSRLLRVLDNYLALPMLLVEPSRSARRRPQYGFLGDFRRKKHGGFEYRTLPSWLADPVVAKGAVAACALITSNYKALPGRPLQDPAVQRMFYAADKASLLPIVQALWQDLERLPGYEALADWLEPYRAAVFGLQVWDEHADFRLAWKISPPAYERQDPGIRAIIGTGVMNAAGGGNR